MNRLEQLAPEIRSQYSPFALEYVQGMLEQFDNPNLFKPHIGVNILHPMEVEATERAKYLNVISYKDIRGNEELLAHAQQVHMVVNTLDAGLGTSFERKAQLERLKAHIGRGDDPQIGSKATDTYECIPTLGGDVYASVASLRLMREIEAAPAFAQVTIQPVVNAESEGPIAQLLETPTVRTLMGESEPMTYAQAIDATPNVQLAPFIKQEFLPTIDAKTHALTIEKVAGGGHGHAAAQLLHGIAELEQSDEHVVYKVSNGDGYTNTASPEMVAIAKKKAAITVLTTTGLDCDVKGGKLLLKQHENEVMTPYILEVGQAQREKQDNEFQHLGDHGEVYFNTNTALFAQEPLQKLFKGIVDHPELGKEYLKYFIAPEFFPNPNGEVFQFDGAMGSLILRMNEIIHTDERIYEIWQQVAEGRAFVQFVNIEPEFRDEFFGPVKFPVDQAEKHTNHFVFDQQALCYRNTRPGHVIHWIGDFVKKKTFYADVSHTQDALGDAANIVALDEFEIEGKVLFANADHGGRQKIISKYDGIVDLNAPEYRQQLGQPVEGRLNLANINILIDEQGIIHLN